MNDAGSNTAATTCTEMLLVGGKNRIPRKKDNVGLQGFDKISLSFLASFLYSFCFSFWFPGIPAGEIRVQWCSNG